MTLWSLAKELLTSGWKAVRLTILDCSQPLGVQNGGADDDDDAGDAGGFQDGHDEGMGYNRDAYMGCVTPAVNANAESFVLWPGEYKRPRAPQERAGPDFGDRRRAMPRRPQRRTGGVKTLKPGRIAALAPEGEGDHFDDNDGADNEDGDGGPALDEPEHENEDIAAQSNVLL
jgi:hypothetical protein